MKNDRYQNEYDRVRRRAKLAQTEFFDPDQPAPEDQAERVRAAAADFRERMETRSQYDAEQYARRQAETNETTRRANESILLNEYAAAGLTPPNGARISLSLLLNIGWTIGDYNGTKTLLKPVNALPKPKEPVADPDDDIGF